VRVVEIFAGETARHVHIRGDGEREVTDMVIDSRKVSEGALFAALGGPHRDGHAYLRAALDAGAGALLVESGQGPAAADAVVVEAEEVRSVLGPAASRFFGKPTERMDLFGVTGTNGKTSVTNILEGILRAAGKATGVMGTIEYRWRDHRQAAACTTPEATDLQRTLAAMADDGVEAAVMEVSSHALAQKRVRGCRFRTAVFF
jgi:UDP-N-acetylmuramoyl-L-alanyl-D-glutamate--2,6-diaminopimelate ligase